MNESLNPSAFQAQPAPEAEKKPPVSWTPRHTLCLLCGAVLSWLWFQIYSFASVVYYIPALGVTIFEWLFLLGGWLCLGRKRPVTRSAKLLLAAAGLTSLTCALHAVWWLNILNALVSMALGLMGLFALTGRTAPWDTFRAVQESFLLTVRGLFRYVSLPFRSIPKRQRDKSASKARAAGLLLGVMLATILLVIIVPLLMSADVMFQRLLDNALGSIVNWMPDAFRFTTLWHVLRWLVLGLLLFSLFTSLQDTDRLHDAAPSIFPQADARTVLPATVILLALNVVYAAFVSVQFTYLFGNVETAAMSGGFAEYARNGFFQLVKVSAVNLLTLLLAVRLLPKFGKGGGLPRGLSLMLILFTMVILASALYRMCLYISVYGLSVKRLLTLWAMVVITVSLIVVAIKLIKADFPLYRFLFVAVLILWLALSAMNVNKVVANYNVDAYLDGQLEQLDVHYLKTLATGIAPAMNKLSIAYGEPGVDWDTYDASAYLWDHYESNWRSWDLCSAWYFLR